ncbi:MAG: hypothetical protein GY797_35525 [Deltaproteobacteria bacterium]|nr:hypothetical protein [Deltaproteobacteria bacterium]
MRRKIVFIMALLLAIPLIGCGFFYAEEWYDTEVRYQVWLKGNDLRVDWGHFNSPAEARTAILRKTPVNTTEESVQDFYLANVEGATVYDWNIISDKYYWDYKTGKIIALDSIGKLTTYCPNSNLYECRVVKIEMPLIESGHFFQRYLADRWMVFFYLDPNNHNLTDVQVQEIGVFEKLLIGLTN